VCGHNVSAFDLRFLVQRFTVHGIRPPAIISRAASAKPWESDKVFDTMTQWAGVGNRVSLEKLCLAFGINSPKTDLDGSKVAAAVAAGRLDDVATYCAGDVEAVRKVFNRLTFAG
jgi:3'-5' exonuclease